MFWIDQTSKSANIIAVSDAVKETTKNWTFLINYLPQISTPKQMTLHDIPLRFFLLLLGVILTVYRPLKFDSFDAQYSLDSVHCMSLVSTRTLESVRISKNEIGIGLAV